MEPSPSLDATIVLRSSQGESHYGARVVIDPSTGAMRADLIDTPSEPGQAPQASLRSVSGRWLFDAVPEGRIRINGVAVAGARIVSAGDVISVAGSQLLIEEAQPRSLALRLFELEGTDTLPPVGDSVRIVAAPAEDLPVELGDVPSVEGALPAAGAARAPRSKLNYAAWVMGVLLAVVLGLFALLRPIALDLQPSDAKVRSLGNFSWQSAASVFVFPGNHTLHAERQGYEPFELKVDASAEQGEEFLLETLDTDDGARTLGELGIGTNYGITAGTGEILLDEKIGGTVHMAVGASYPECGGQNESAVHTDLVCDLRGGGRIEVDGEPFQEDGRFLV